MKLDVLVFDDGRYVDQKPEFDVVENVDFVDELKVLGFKEHPMLVLGDINSDFFIEVFEYDWIAYKDGPKSGFQYYVCQNNSSQCHTILIKNLPNLNTFLASMTPIITASLLTDYLKDKLE